MGTNVWEPITHLVSLGLSNKDGLRWKLWISLYVDETRKSVRGGCPGWIDDQGFHRHHDMQDGYYYKAIWDKEGYFMFFRQLKELVNNG